MRPPLRSCTNPPADDAWRCNLRRSPSAGDALVHIPRRKPFACNAFRPYIEKHHSSAGSYGGMGRSSVGSYGGMWRCSDDLDSLSPGSAGGEGWGEGALSPWPLPRDIKSPPHPHPLPRQSRGRGSRRRSNRDALVGPRPHGLPASRPWSSSPVSSPVSPSPCSRTSPTAPRKLPRGLDRQHGIPHGKEHRDRGADGLR